MIDIHILELLASKICHDLISPVGAIGNGVEFLEEMGADAGEEATQLIAFSAAQASAKLQAYRLAYGAGGSDATHKPADVHHVIDLILKADGKGKLKQIWDPDLLNIPKDGLGAYPTGFCKLLVSLLLLAQDCLPRGGTIDVTQAPHTPNEIVITMEGPGAALQDGVRDALTLSTDKEALHPKVIHAYVCALLAKHYRHAISIKEENTDLLRLQISLP